jgi:hypothetical protein
MPVTISCETSKGGAAKLGKDVTVSYAVAGVADLPVAELFYAWVKLPNGKTVQVFVNRETGLIVVDVVRKDERGGNEILRANANGVSMPDKWVAEQQAKEIPPLHPVDRVIGIVDRGLAGEPEDERERR